MLKKFVSSIFAVFLLVACAGGESAAAPKNPADVATTIIKDLELTENVEEVADRIIPGLFFFEEGTVSASKFYAADKLADCVAVFTTSDPASCEKAVREYLSTRKAQLEMYAPSEVFKVDNAVIRSNGNTTVMIVCEDIEAAEKLAGEILSK